MTGTTGVGRRLEAFGGRAVAALLHSIDRLRDRNGRAPEPRRSVSARLRRDGMYVTGRRGRLFLAHDSNDTIEQHGGRRLLSDAALNSWQEQLEGRTARLLEKGVQYVMLVAPNAHAVYPEDLPAGVLTAPRRPARQLLDHLAAHGAQTRVLYPLAELLDEKQRREVYPRTDTHWNEFGALTAYERLADELDGRVPMRRVREEDFMFVPARSRGDLGHKRRFTRGAPTVVALARHPTARLVHDNLVENTGCRLVTECRAAPPGTCVVFADSNAFALLPFLAESFRRVVLAQHPAVDWDVVREEQPLTVLTVISERFLSNRQDERNGWFSEVARAKLEQGQTRPRIDRWDVQVSSHVAPVQVELMRALLRDAGRHADAALIAAMAYGGLWPAELHRLRWRDVDSDLIHVPAPNGIRRRVSVLPPLGSDLQEWRAISEAREEDDLVFPAAAGSHWPTGEWQAWIRGVYQPVAERVGLAKTRPAALCQTLPALLIQEGVTFDRLFAQIGGVRKGAEGAYRWQAKAAARGGHASAEAQILRARRYAASAAALVAAEPDTSGQAEVHRQFR